MMILALLDCDSPEQTLAVKTLSTLRQSKMVELSIILTIAHERRDSGFIVGISSREYRDSY